MSFSYEWNGNPREIGEIADYLRNRSEKQFPLFVSSTMQIEGDSDIGATLRGTRSMDGKTVITFRDGNSNGKATWRAMSSRLALDMPELAKIDIPGTVDTYPLERHVEDMYRSQGLLLERSLHDTSRCIVEYLTTLGVVPQVSGHPGGDYDERPTQELPRIDGKELKLYFDPKRTERFIDDAGIDNIFTCTGELRHKTRFGNVWLSYHHVDRIPAFGLERGIPTNDRVKLLRDARAGMGHFADVMESNVYELVCVLAKIGQACPTQIAVTLNEKPLDRYKERMQEYRKRILDWEREHPLPR